MKTMSTPSWRQFRAIPFDATVAAVIKALDIEVPKEGRPTGFRAEKFLTSVTDAGDWVVLCEGEMARFVDSPEEVRKAARLPAGTPSGDALRMWLRWWGWVPKSEQRQAEPQAAVAKVGSDLGV